MLKKTAMIVVVTGLLVAALLVSVGFANTSEEDSVLEGLYQEMESLGRQIMDRHIELGDLTPEQSERMLEGMQRHGGRFMMQGHMQRAYEDGGFHCQ